MGDHLRPQQLEREATDFTDYTENDCLRQGKGATNCTNHTNGATDYTDLH